MANSIFYVFSLHTPIDCIFLHPGNKVNLLISPLSKLVVIIISFVEHYHTMRDEFQSFQEVFIMNHGGSDLYKPANLYLAKLS